MNSGLNILVVRFSALGDVAMTIPAIYNVANAYPQHTFHMLTSSFYTQLFINSPKNVIIHSVEDKRIGNILKLLRTLHIDIVADLHNVLLSWLIDAHYLLRGKRIAMLDKRRTERFAITHRHKATWRPFTLRYLDVFARLGLGISNIAEIFVVPRKDKVGKKKNRHSSFCTI